MNRELAEAIAWLERSRDSSSPSIAKTHAIVLLAELDRRGTLAELDDLPPGAQLELGQFVRGDDLDSARRAGETTLANEGGIKKLRPGTHRHLTLRVYADAYPDELTATEAGQRATPGHDRVTGGTRRTYDLRATRLVARGKRGYAITDRGRAVLEQLDRGIVVDLEQ